MLTKEFNMKPNMLAVIRIEDFSANSTLVLPERAILEDRDGASYVFIEKDGIAKKIDIN